MQAHALTIGAEILAGDIVDSNFKDIAEMLRDRGLVTAGHISVQDDVREISKAVRRSIEDGSSFVLLTGGLGPTPDDVTRDGIAAAFDLELTYREELLPDLEALFRRYTKTRPMPQSNHRQLYLPEGAEALNNPLGSAPGIWLETQGAVVAAVPGIPREMRNMVSEDILPRLARKFELPRVLHRVLRTQGIGESELYERLKPVMDSWRGVSAAFYPQTPGVDLKLIHVGKDLKRAESYLDYAQESAHSVIGDACYATDKSTSLAMALGAMLKSRGWSLALAESCTGGALGGAVISAPGSSEYFLGGLTAYSNTAKIELLGVPNALIETHGSVSEPVALALAEGVRKRFGAEAAIATTGIAGPGGGSDEKPVGLVYTAVVTPAGTRCYRDSSPGTRDMVVKRTVVNAMNRLRLEGMRSEDH